MSANSTTWRPYTTISKPYRGIPTQNATAPLRCEDLRKKEESWSIGHHPAWPGPSPERQTLRSADRRSDAHDISNTNRSTFDSTRMPYLDVDASHGWTSLGSPWNPFRREGNSSCRFPTKGAQRMLRAHVSFAASAAISSFVADLVPAPQYYSHWRLVLRLIHIGQWPAHLIDDANAKSFFYCSAIQVFVLVSDTRACQSRKVTKWRQNRRQKALFSCAYNSKKVSYQWRKTEVWSGDY